MNETSREPTRRGFLGRVWLLLGGVALLEAVWVVAEFLKPRRRGPAPDDNAAIFVAGPIERFQPGTVTAFPAGRFYLARLEDGGLPRPQPRVHPPRLYRALGGRRRAIRVSVPRLGLRHQGRRSEPAGAAAARYLPGAHRKRHRQGRTRRTHPPADGLRRTGDRHVTADPLHRWRLIGVAGDRGHRPQRARLGHP